MNAFRSVLNDLNLTAETAQGSNNVDSFMYLLLAYAADLQDANAVEATYSSNAYREVLHRFRNYKGFASQRIAQMLSAGAL